MLGKNITLQVYQTKDKDIWRVFRQHHYLSAEMNKASRIYTIYWNDVLVGIRTYLYLPNGSMKYCWRGSRLVILPDYQNLGIGSAVLEFLGDYYISQGLKYFDRSSHLRLKKHWTDSPKWRETSKNNKHRSVKESENNKFTWWKYDTERICGSFEYMGNDYATKPHKKIIVDTEIGETITKDELINLKDKYYLTVVTGKPKVDNEVELMCLELGIRTEMLYYNKKGNLVRKKV